MSATAPVRRTHVLIAAERLPTRVGLRLALEPQARCTEAADAESAVDAAIRDRPDVCLLGLDASGQGLRAANEIASRVPTAAVILLTNRLDEEEFMAAMRAGASGYLTNGVDPVSRREFWELIHRLASEGTTVLLTTHYMDEAERCHRLSFIFGGTVSTGEAASRSRRASGTSSSCCSARRPPRRSRPSSASHRSRSAATSAPSSRSSELRPGRRL